jgi:hypothetical protein
MSDITSIKTVPFTQVALKSRGGAGKAVHVDNIDKMNAAQLSTALQKFNIKLSDGNSQQVMDWLNSSYSGYQQLAKQVLHLLNDGKPLPNGQNDTPLNNIQGHLERVTNVPAWKVAQTNQEYEAKELKAGIFGAWQEKNSGDSRFSTPDELFNFLKVKEES